MPRGAVAFGDSAPTRRFRYLLHVLHGRTNIRKNKLISMRNRGILTLMSLGLRITVIFFSLSQLSWLEAFKRASAVALLLAVAPLCQPRKTDALTEDRAQAHRRLDFRTAQARLFGSQAGCSGKAHRIGLGYGFMVPRVDRASRCFEASSYAMTNVPPYCLSRCSALTTIPPGTAIPLNARRVSARSPECATQSP